MNMVFKVLKEIVWPEHYVYWECGCRMTDSGMGVCMEHLKLLIAANGACDK